MTDNLTNHLCTMPNIHFRTFFMKIKRLWRRRPRLSGGRRIKGLAIRYLVWRNQTLGFDRVRIIFLKGSATTIYDTDTDIFNFISHYGFGYYLLQESEADINPGNLAVALSIKEKAVYRSISLATPDPWIRSRALIQGSGNARLPEYQECGTDKIFREIPIRIHMMLL